MNRITFALASAAALAAAPSAAVRSTPHFTSLTVLGDSLVDAGNVYDLTGGFAPSKAKGYVEGRFTNGYDYTDLLSKALFGGYTEASRTGGTNHAYGNARIIGNGDAFLDLAEQTAELGAIDPNGLYVLNFGGNDIFAADSGDIGGYASPTAYVEAAADAYAKAIGDLSAAGARNIFFTDFPVITSQYNQAANDELAAAIANLSLAPSTTLYQYSLSGFEKTVLGNPGSYGIDPAKIGRNCVADKAQTSGCAGYFSFDGTHPTAAIQQYAFDDIEARYHLTAAQPAVPEPGSWAMTIGGIGLAGAALRRRRRTAAFA